MLPPEHSDGQQHQKLIWHQGKEPKQGACHCTTCAEQPQSAAERPTRDLIIHLETGFVPGPLSSHHSTFGQCTDPDTLLIRDKY